MRPFFTLIGTALVLGYSFAACAQSVAAATSKTSKAQPIEITADQSLEYYQDQRMYVARGNAKAVRGEMSVEADLLSAHQSEKPKDSDATIKNPKAKKGDAPTGDIDKMTAEGNVRISTPTQRVI